MPRTPTDAGNVAGTRPGSRGDHRDDAGPSTHERSRLAQPLRRGAAISSRSPGAGHPRQLQRIIRVARDHVHVEVEDRLPGRRAARVQQVDPVGAEPLGDTRAASRCAATATRRQVLRVGLEQIRDVRLRGTTSAWPRVAGLMSMNATVLVLGNDLPRGSSPATILQNRQSGSLMAGSLLAAARRRSRAISRSPPRAGSTSPLKPPPRARQQLADARARRNPERPRQLVAADRRSRRIGCSRPAPRASIWRASSRCLAIAALGVVAARREPVRDAQHASRRPRPGCRRPGSRRRRGDPAASGARGSRAADGGRSAPRHVLAQLRRSPAAGAGSRRRHPAPARSWPMNVTRPSSVTARVCGLGDVVQQRAEAQRLAAGQLVGERRRQQLPRPPPASAPKAGSRIALERDRLGQHRPGVPEHVEMVKAALLDPPQRVELGQHRRR